MNKYVLKKSVHFGFLKETFPKGTVVTHDAENFTVTIDGKTYETDKDMKILLRSPNDEFLSPYSEEKVEQYIEEDKNDKINYEKNLPDSIKKKLEVQERMEIVQSDQDTHKEIDIKHTKKQKALLPKEINGMEVIKGDESFEERINRLENTPAKMEIVADDGSLGVSNGSVSLNASVAQIRTAEEHAKLKKTSKGEYQGVEVTEANLNEISRAETPQETARNIIDTNAETVIVSTPENSKGSENKKAGRPKGSKNNPKRGHQKNTATKRAKKVTVNK